MVYNWAHDDVRVIVVTDGSRILGLGDLGVNGMGIPIGKLSLYTAIAGIHPSHCLPVILDVGTNNEELINDPAYLGLPRPRVRGQEYLDLVDEFVQAVKERWPNVLIQFEDFSNEWAEPLLSKYRNNILCFNDDIQGTGTVLLAALLSSLRAIGKYDENALTKQKIVIAGAGSAGCGVANSILFGLKMQGLTLEEGAKQIYMLDDKGLLGKNRKVSPFQTKFQRDDMEDKLSLLETIKQVKPDIDRIMWCSKFIYRRYC